MSKIKNSCGVGLPLLSPKSFDDYRNFIVDELNSQNILFKKKISQGIYWASLDKDIANQYVREEKWIFGLKYKDELKLIDHGFLNDEDIKLNRNVGFKK